MIEKEWPVEIKLNDTPRQIQDKLRYFMYSNPSLDMVDYIKRSMDIAKNGKETKQPISLDWSKAFKGIGKK